MVTKPISQNVTISAEDGSVRLLVNPDGSINVNTGGGTTADVNLSEVGGAAITQGQKAMAASLPVVIASNQSALPITVADGASATLGTIADAAAAAGGVGTISAKLRRMSTQLPAALGQATAAASLPVVLASDVGQIGVAYSAPLTITRPANQTPYTAGDVVGGALTFPSVGPSAGRIMLTSSQLELDIAAIPTGMTSFTLYLYNVTPPSALADNAPFDLPSGDRTSFLGAIPLGTPTDLGSTLYVEQNIINKQIKLAGTSLFGYLVTTGGFTPAANSEVYVATLHSVGLGL